tara:strand:- start:53 stop:154 length:102 start_codon:yes stop_codon:yes gene_type:complete
MTERDLTDNMMEFHEREEFPDEIDFEIWRESEC